MAFPKGFSPHRHHPGGSARSLTAYERSKAGSPCPHCGKNLVEDATPFSKFVHCPDNVNMFVDPENAGEPMWRFKRASGPRATVSSPSSGVPTSHWKKTASGVSGGVKLVSPSGAAMAKSFAALSELSEKLMHEKAGNTNYDAGDAVPPRKAVVQPGKEPNGFPYPRFRKLADAVQAAHSQGKVGSGYSLRRELMTARLWQALNPDMGTEKALHLAFALVGSERATDDERPFYVELWKAQMGTNLYPLPEVTAPKHAKDEEWHPQAGLALAVIRAGIPLWLAGEAGAGKTHLTRQIAKHEDKPYVRLQGSRDRTVDEVIGGWGYDPAVGSVFRPGVVVECARNGGVLHIDEVSALPHEVTFELHAVLEGEPLTVLKNSGEVVTLNDKFRIVANDNSVGEGEQAAYVGTHATNLAFRDRWAFLRVEQMPADMRKRLILKAAGE